MKRFFHRKRDALIASAVVSALAASSGLAYAHMRDGEGPGGPGYGDGHKCGFSQHRHERWGAGQHMAGKLAFLKAELKITKDQETAWQDFSKAMADLDGQRAQLHETMRGSFKKDADASIVDRIDRRIAGMETGLSLMKKLSGAVKTLYGVLTPEQQKQANELFPFHEGPGRHRHG